MSHTRFLGGVAAKMTVRPEQLPHLETRSGSCLAVGPAAKSRRVGPRVAVRRIARFGPTTPTRARRLADASVDPTEARNLTVDPSRHHLALGSYQATQIHLPAADRVAPQARSPPPPEVEARLGEDRASRRRRDSRPPGPPSSPRVRPTPPRR